MGNKSKNIGKGFERDIANQLTAFFKLPFQRVPNSGGFVGGSNYTRMASMSGSQILLTRGDIIVPDEMPRLMIECKKRNSIAYHQFMHIDGSKEINSWIDQCLVDVEHSDVSIFLLVFKSNNVGKFVLFDAGKLNPGTNYVCYSYNNRAFWITEFDERFLEANKETFLKECAPRPKEPKPLANEEK